MDIVYISVCFIALFATCFGQDPLEVNFENATRVDAMEGTKVVHFRCHLNRDAMYVINNQVDIVHVHPITKEETIMSSAANLVEGMPQYYEVKMAKHPDDSDSMVLDFIIKEVRYSDDGTYKCHVHPGGKSDSIEEGFAEREIVVHRPVTTLKMKLGDFDAIETSPVDALQIDHGEYKVVCMAEGSNPATEDVHLSFHGLMLEHSTPTVTPMDGPDRQFKTEIDGSLKIMVSNSGQELVCQSMDSTGQSKSVKLTINVNTYDPLVSCNDTEAHLGQANPTIYCTVNYTGLDVDGYAYQVGDTGVIVKAGENTRSDNIVVTVQDISPGISVVSLDLHKAEQQYLDKNYYLLIDMKGGHTSKETVRLNKKEAPVPEEGNESGDGDDNGGDASGSGTGSGDNNDMGGGGGDGVRLTPVVVLYLLTCVLAFCSWH